MSIDIVPLVTAFTFIFLAELGDKTQLASVVLAAELNSPLLVLTGIMLAFSVVTAIGVIFGSKLLRFVPEKYLKIGTSFLFMLFGFLFIWNSILK